VTSQRPAFAQWEDTVRQALASGLAELAPDGMVSVLLTDDAEIAALNATYRGRSGPTDVLSFSQREGDPGPEPVELLGDIVISVERAEAQAAEYGHSPAREMGFLAVHGLLHLLGYDHEHPDEEAEMMALTERILGRVGLTRS
jgi:probable rRNA maturation factor